MAQISKYNSDSFQSIIYTSLHLIFLFIYNWQEVVDQECKEHFSQTACYIPGTFNVDVSSLQEGGGGGLRNNPTVRYHIMSCCRWIFHEFVSRRLSHIAFWLAYIYTCIPCYNDKTATCHHHNTGTMTITMRMSTCMYDLPFI